MSKRYTVTLEPVTGHTNPIGALRRCLKAMLRGYGLRCIRVSEATPATAKANSEAMHEAALQRLDGER